MQKYFLSFFLFVAAFLLIGGCSNQVVIDYLPTITAYETQVAEHQTEAAELEADFNDAIENNQALEDTVATLEATITEMQEEADDLSAENASLLEQATAFYDLLVVNSENDTIGEYVLCTHAFETEFAYIDKVSMRKELANYLAEANDWNVDTIETEHQMIWSNSDDGLIRVYANGYLYPYIVMFENSDIGYKNSTYSLGGHCFADFPALEENILAIQGE